MKSLIFFGFCALLAANFSMIACIVIIAMMAITSAIREQTELQAIQTIAILDMAEAREEKREQ